MFVIDKKEILFLRTLGAIVPLCHRGAIKSFLSLPSYLMHGVATGPRISEDLSQPTWPAIGVGFKRIKRSAALVQPAWGGGRGGGDPMKGLKKKSPQKQRET